MRSWLPIGIRARLLAAFVTLLAAAIVLTLVGGLGMRGTQDALAEFQQDVMPGIANALELAERTAQLAAIVPHLAEARTREQLQSSAGVVEGLLADLDRRSGHLSPVSELQPVMSRLLENVGRDLSSLIALTRQRQATQSRLRDQVLRLDRVGAQLRSGGGNAGPRPDRAIPALWSSLVLGATTESQATLGELQADVEALLRATQERRAWHGVDKPVADTLTALASDAGNVLALRRELGELDQRAAYLVALTRINADQLADEVARHAAGLRTEAAQRSDEVRRAVRSRETTMLALALASIVIGLGATRYVGRLMAEIQGITRAMGRLAQGDTPPSTRTASRRDELGALARGVEVFRDTLLAKSRLVADLERQSDLIDAVHGSMTDALAVFDRDGRLRLWNPQLPRLLGQPADAPHIGLTRERLLAAYPAGTRWTAPGQTPLQPLDPAGADALGVHDHIELHLPSGSAHDLRSRPMPGGGVVTLVTDVTVRRAIETQQQSTRRLELLGQWTGGVAHDFNNQLGTIVGNLALLDDEPGLDAAGRLRLQRARRAAAAAAGLTRRLLAFARRQALQSEPVPVDAMIEEMRDLIEYSAGPRVVVTLRLGAPGAWIRVDRGQLENAVLNLAINSAAAMPSGGELWVHTEVTDGDPQANTGTSGAMARIEIGDTGTGIPAELVDRVFEPFFTTKPAHQGSGLGLSIVYGFVRQSGGRIALASTPGSGTRVTLSFPIDTTAPSGQPATSPAEMAPAAASGPGAIPSAHAAAAAASTVPPTGGQPAALLRLLLVDDDAAFRDTVADLLGGYRLALRVAASGEQAIEMLESDAGVDAVLSDLQLGPGMDGLQLARTLHARWPALRVTLMSGLPPELVPGGDTRGDGLPFLQKPFTRETLDDWMRTQGVA